MHDIIDIVRKLFREQRSSSEDSLIKLLQYSPTIHEKNETEDEDDSFAISR